jgi:hypothetical protein
MASWLLRRRISVAPVLILEAGDECVAKAGTFCVSLRSFHAPVSEAATTDAMRVYETLSNDQFPYITAAFGAVGTAMNGVSN